MALAARTGRHPSTHFAPEMCAEDVECITCGHGRHTIHFFDSEGLAQYIHVHVTSGVLTVCGHTATFHDAVGACPPLRLFECDVFPGNDDRKNVVTEHQTGESGGRGRKGGPRV